MTSEQPLRLLLSGYFGFDNAGDEAIFESLVENFRRLHPGVRLAALVQGEETARRLDVEPIPRKDVGAVWKALKRSTPIPIPAQKPARKTWLIKWPQS